jgi:hypothetical protein
MLANIAERFSQTTSVNSALRTIAIPRHGEPLRHLWRGEVASDITS